MSDVSQSPIVKKMVDEVVKICSPYLVFLVSNKTNAKGELTAFKLCIVAEDSFVPQSLETKLLIETDCDIPCDFIVYNKTEWNDCAEDDCSFAYRVDNGGVLLYGEE